ncbi:hypothetical protein CQ017_16430 [Arthrobacter sp. MYb224]|nr:hypothetical protein CQ017_16430 [Arthrobacter sp. MYb224]
MVGSLEASSLDSYPIVVSEFAPLAIFGGSGKALAIDGRPVDMPLDVWEANGADENSGSNATVNQRTQGDTKVPAERAQLVGRLSSVGQLPGNLQLMHPVTTRRISSPYGWRANPTGPGNQIHIGQDYPISCGSPVYASESGTVTVSRWAGHSGMRVTIDHEHNVQTGYSHNSKLLVKVGQRVQQGEVIALAGTTGNSTGCHVHFEVLVNGRWTDPRLYLPSIPGQRQAMIDSSRLTVDAKSAPKGGKNSPSKNDDDRQSKESRKEQNPDVVVPKDDTPVVPKPEPKSEPTPKAKPSPKPSESTKPSKTPSVKPTPSPSKSPSAKPTPSASEEPSKSPSAKPSASPSPSQSEEQKPTQSPSKSPSVTPSPTKLPEKSAEPTVKPKATQSPSDSPKESAPSIEAPKQSAKPTPSVKPSQPPKVTPETQISPSASAPLLKVPDSNVLPTLKSDKSKTPDSSAQEKSAKRPESTDPEE